jgi:predicted ATPase
VQVAATHALQQLQDGALRLEDGGGARARGAYIHGPVGGGKSLLMDMFHETSSEARPKHRMHFHELMVDVHQRLHAVHTSRPKSVVLTEQGMPIFRFGEAPVPPAAEIPPAVEMRRAGADGQAAERAPAAAAAPAGEADGAPVQPTDAPAPPPPPPPEPLEIVASQLVPAGSLLCLDEMQVTDVADAMILRRLFELLIDRHSVDLVFTSNRPPEQLYERGLNRQYFLPFVALVRDRLRVIPLGGSLDYRSLPPPAEEPVVGGGLRVLAARTPGTLYHGPGAVEALLAEWVARGGTADPAGGGGSPPPNYDRVGPAPSASPRELVVGFGRTLPVQTHAGDAVWFSFSELCAPAPGGRPLGAPDYHAVARAFRHVYIAGVPVLSKKERNEARRLVVLIDALYEARCALHLVAAAPLEALLVPLLAASDEEMQGAAEVAVDETGQHALPFEGAEVGGTYRPDGELAAFFTAKDEVFMMRRTLSRLTEMCRPVGGG